MRNPVKILVICVFSSLNLLSSQDIIFPSSTTKSNFCQISINEYGICTPLQNCPHVAEGIRSGLNPTHCGFQGGQPIVCCPAKLGDAGNILSERITQRNVTSPFTNFTCGIRTLVRLKQNLEGLSRVRREHFRFAVAGGVPAFKNSWPWMALLGRKRGDSESFFCSAVLINGEYLITAAHCLLNVEPFFVRLGEHDYGPEFGDTLLKLEEDVEVDRLLFHPNYTLENKYHDIALIKLSRPVAFKNEISPICLPWGALSTQDLVNELVTVTGWGRLSFGGIQSTVLQEVNVTVFDPSKCAESYSTLKDYHKDYPKGMTRDNIICAGDVDGAKDACQGDSGGPMMSYNSETNTYSLAGIISTGYGCGLKDFPGIYTPIRNVDTLQWIKDTAFTLG